MKKTYIGDGIYMSISSVGEVLLTTENGVETTNSIILESDIMDSVISFYNQYKERK